MIINGDGGYGLLAAYIGGLAAQAGWCKDVYIFVQLYLHVLGL